MGPPEDPDAPVGVVGHDLGRVPVDAIGTHGGEPDVEHPLMGGDPRQAGPIGGDAGAYTFWVPKQDLPWDEFCHAPCLSLPWVSLAFRHAYHGRRHDQYYLQVDILSTTRVEIPAHCAVRTGQRLGFAARWPARWLASPRSHHMPMRRCSWPRSRPGPPDRHRRAAGERGHGDR